MIMGPKDEPPKTSTSSIQPETSSSFSTASFSNFDDSLMGFEYMAGQAAGTTTVPSSSGGEAENNIGVPQPLGWLQEISIPPFLTKTFELVDDPVLDPIISWGSRGESFVVWDPVEFSSVVLPRNFKHSNFSSFVRQLNTYGFRKIDTDRWEFANEAFQRGKRHLLKNIQRRKSHQSQQIGVYNGPSTEAGKPGLDNEIERLKKEKSTMMQEVVELQQQHRGTMHHMEAVNERLQSAEQRQQQMISFLTKMLQNPAFLELLRQKKEQRKIDSPRVRRKFVKQHQHEIGKADSSMDGQIVKYQADWGLPFVPSSGLDLNPPVEHSQDYLSPGMVTTLEEMGLGAESIPFQFENVESVELAMPDEFAVLQGFAKTPEQVGEGSSRFRTEDLKGKNVVSPPEEINTEYLVSYPEEIMEEKALSQLSPGIKSITKQEEIWSMGFDASTVTPSSRSELWGTPINYEIPDLEVTGGLSDMWDLGSLQVAGGLGIDKWTADESSFGL
ncbi:heat stress transcription factor A-6a isoform X2 [Quercus robur]|uniref:heat stress transcription factor A-6a isoform X2 n=1 Tax=Quercus robur TaxID=38942 RepID=UPI0021624998|nr:heat stress transcription factor A-6a isoform X2 [Quercus robur]